MAHVCFRYVLAIAAFLAVAGCSSSGTAIAPIRPAATPSAMATAVTTPSPTPSVTPLGTLTRAVVRMSAQGVLSAMRPIVFAMTRSSSTGFVVFDRRRASGADKVLAASACTAGNTSTVTSDQPDPNGLTKTVTTSFVNHVFYDQACTQPWFTDTGTASTTSSISPPTYMSTSVAEEESVFGRSGEPLEIDQITASSGAPGAGVPSYELKVTTAENNSATDLFEIDCIGGNGCVFGDIEHLATNDALPAVGIFIRDMPGQQGSTDVSYDAYEVQGSNAATVFDNNPEIVGQTITQDVLETRANPFKNGPGEAIQIVDATNDVASAATYDTSVVTGTVTQTSKSLAVAKFAIDGNGYGAITYSDGSLGNIAAFAIQN